MSDALLELFAPDKTVIGYSVYHGSSDTVHPDVIFDTIEEAMAARHNFGDDHPECKPEDHVSLVAWAYSHYAGGFHWPTWYCTKCRHITGRLSPYPVDYGWSIPTDDEAEAERIWREWGWPRKGTPWLEDRIIRPSDV